MLYGVREICDVVLKAKTKQQIGNKTFFKDEPVLYFDTLKTSSFEQAATTVYATGGRGNTQLVAWDGEKKITFNMEDALISPIGLSILSGAGLIQPAEGKPIYVHTTEQLVVETSGAITLSEDPAAAIAGGSDSPSIYVMELDENGEVTSEPHLYKPGPTTAKNIVPETRGDGASSEENTYNDEVLDAGTVVLVDYYVKKESGAFVVDISPESFGGNYYLEASTLWRAKNGKDYPAEFIIPNCKPQSNFTFNMAATGDPSTFSFVMDAFPDYTRWDKTKKVLAEIQIIGATLDGDTEYRTATPEA